MANALGALVLGWGIGDTHVLLDDGDIVLLLMLERFDSNGADGEPPPHSIERWSRLTVDISAT